MIPKLGFFPVVGRPFADTNCMILILVLESQGRKGHDQGGNEDERNNKKFEERRSRYEVQGKNAVYDRSHLG